jgi:predicted small metal-binding protein
MAHVLSCRDVGVDCPAQFRGSNTEEVLSKAMEHGRKDHGIRDFNPELLAKMRAAVKEEPATA